MSGTNPWGHWNSAGLSLAYGGKGQRGTWGRGEVESGKPEKGEV